MSAPQNVLKEAARKRGLRISCFYVDNGYSAETLERPAFEVLMRDCKSGKIGMVLVTDVTRVARYVDTVLEALESFGRYKTRVAFVDADGLRFFRTAMGAVEDGG